MSTISFLAKIGRAWVFRNRPFSQESFTDAAFLAVSAKTVLAICGRRATRGAGRGVVFNGVGRLWPFGRFWRFWRCFGAVLAFFVFLFASRETAVLVLNWQFFVAFFCFRGTGVLVLFCVSFLRYFSVP